MSGNQFPFIEAQLDITAVSSNALLKNIAEGKPHTRSLKLITPALYSELSMAALLDY
jgi:hypothetical protein